MKYLLFANNNELNESACNNIDLDLNDILVTFNHAWPINHLNIFKNNTDNKIYHFSRRSFNRKIPYSGLHIIDDLQNKFEKIFLYPHPNAIGSSLKKKEVLNYLKDKTNLSTQDIQHMPNFGSSANVKEARQFLSQHFNKIRNLSMGLIGYLYIQQIKKPDDKIILVGFTHKMNNNKHNAQGEKAFFHNQQEKNLCQII
jgi:hypothetical protein